MTAGARISTRSCVRPAGFAVAQSAGAKFPTKQSSEPHSARRNAVTGSAIDASTPRALSVSARSLGGTTRGIGRLFSSAGGHERDSRSRGRALFVSLASVWSVAESFPAVRRLCVLASARTLGISGFTRRSTRPKERRKYERRRNRETGPDRRAYSR